MQHVSASYWSACICSIIGKHTLACNRHEIKCFLLQESTDQKCLWVCLLHIIVISLVSEYHHQPSMMHLSTHQDISLGLKIVHVHCTRTIFRPKLYTYKIQARKIRAEAVQHHITLTCKKLLTDHLDVDLYIKRFCANPRFCRFLSSYRCILVSTQLQTPMSTDFLP